VAITYVMGGIAREFARPHEELRAWLDAAERSAMPSTRACGSTRRRGRRIRPAWPSRRREQGRDAAVLRRLREASRSRAGAWTPPTRSWRSPARSTGCSSSASASTCAPTPIVEAFGADLERARSGQVPRWEVAGEATEDVLAAVRAAAPSPRPLPPVEEALRTFGA
jgi:hypothetical protein